MCDTFVNVPSGPESPVIFGKNSDREPNEAQQIVHYPTGIRHEEHVNATYIEVDCKREVNEVILSKPFQMWGAEMGVNRHGVAIGNEAVFTKMNFEKRNTGLTGMDLVRLGLEAGNSAKEALEVIIRNLEKYGQNACGGYEDRKFYYHNSFIIADLQTAFVLETAGPFWAYKEVRGYRAISNGLSLEGDYHGIANGAIEYAQKKRWISGSGDFNFRKAFSAFWMPRLAACDARRSLSEGKARDMQTMKVSDAFSVLRTHADKDFHPSKARTNSLCMHASGLFCPHQTTGSMVVEVRKNAPATIWLTGSSAPCLSLFKPFYFGSDVLNEENFRPPGQRPDYDSESYWWQFEKFHRKALTNYDFMFAEIQSDQTSVESSWIQRDLELAYGSIEQKNEFSRECISDSIAVLEGWRSSLLIQEKEEGIQRVPFLYQWFWNRQNKRVKL